MSENEKQKSVPFPTPSAVDEKRRDTYDIADEEPRRAELDATVGDEGGAGISSGGQPGSSSGDRRERRS